MKRPVVTIEMKGGGKIKIQLEPEVAPNTVNNFISLVENGYYDGLTFHRVIPGFMIQGGCPEGTGTGGPGYSIKGEFTSNDHRNDLKHERGAVSMARSASPDSAGSQFFIVLETASHLDREYAAFGKVISGMEEVDRIVNASDGDPDENGKVRGQVQVMKKVTVETFGIAYDQPEKL
ncbi:MAG: peptidylprolyl isomerase [Firmicutes bacterium]|nr:peptidylprolyl isomerase [Bacillota bacterium]